MFDVFADGVGVRKALSYLAMAAGFVATLSSSSLPAVPRCDATSRFVFESKALIWQPDLGDTNNDGFLDLIVPSHGLLRSHGPFVYPNNAGNTVANIHHARVSPSTKPKILERFSKLRRAVSEEGDERWIFFWPHFFL